MILPNLSKQKRNMAFVIIAASLVCTGMTYGVIWIRSKSVQPPIATDFTLAASPYGVRSMDSSNERVTIDNQGADKPAVALQSRLSTQPIMPTQSLRTLFDSALNGWREKEQHTILKSFKTLAQSQYSEPNLSRVEKLFSQYFEYQRRLDDIPPSDQSIESMIRYFRQVVALRREVLGKQMATALFSTEESFNRFALARAHILQNNTLSDLEKNLLIGKLEDNLPGTLIANPTQAPAPTPPSTSSHRPDQQQEQVTLPLSNLFSDGQI